MTRQPTTVVHVIASRFFGGPERQMLGLAGSLPASIRSMFVSFSEGDLCQAFLREARGRGFQATGLRHDTPRLVAALQELIALLKDIGADLLCCHGYKANLLGLLAARRLGIPVISVSRGWTGESLRVRLYESLDRRVLRRMDRVVCVSEGQAEKIRRAGVPGCKLIVIHNAVRTERFAQRLPEYRDQLRDSFAEPPQLIVGAAGRLSPEKGFDVLVDAAAIVVRADPNVGFVLFGDGKLGGALTRQVHARQLNGAFVLVGFRPDLDRFLPHLDLLVQSSYTEGMPNVLLEASAAGVPVVATAVGGTSEVVEDGVSGYLVPPGDSSALARRITDLLSDAVARRVMGARGRQRVLQQFSFPDQAHEYRRLFAQLAAKPTCGNGDASESS